MRNTTNTKVAVKTQEGDWVDIGYKLEIVDDIVMPDFDQWAGKLQSMFSEDIHLELKQIWDMARAYERRQLHKKLDELFLS